MSMRRRFTVRVERLVRQSESVEVLAENAEEAKSLVLDGIAPVQWPDGTYVERLHSRSKNFTITATKGGA